MEKLLNLLGDHPLSLSLVGPHLKTLLPAEICADFASLLDQFKDESAEEGRNKSLLASLAFSTSRLGAEAQAVLPWLAWFQGGAFELSIRRFTQISYDAWSAIRAELEATALLVVEEAGFSVPFLRLHPTLLYAARREEVVDTELVQQRFVAVYLMVMQEIDTALHGPDAALGMTLMQREEGNLRSALEIAFGRGERLFGWKLAETLGVFLQMAARPRELDLLVDWVRKQMDKEGGLEFGTCAAIQQQALSLVGRGQADDAVEMMRNLIGRIKEEGLADRADSAFILGTSFGFLGQILVYTHQPTLAIAPCLKSIEILEKVQTEAAQGNLATSFGSLANAHRAVGRLEAALAAAEHGLSINQKVGRKRNEAASLGQCAEILGAQHRWAKADDRFQEALSLAQSIGDKGLQGSLLQQHGILHGERGDPAREADLYQQAMPLFQQAGNAGSEMRTCDLLGSAELRCGRFDVAAAWYGRARELALALNDRHHLSLNAHNVSILYQTRAEKEVSAEGRADCLGRALTSIRESLEIRLERNDKVGAAMSYSQLGVLYRELGELELADRKLNNAREILETLDDPNLWKIYGKLSEIAAARGDAAEAAEWAAKREAKWADLEQRRLVSLTPPAERKPTPPSESADPHS